MANTNGNKTSVYDSLSAVNRATDELTEHIERLKAANRLKFRMADLFRFAAEELRAQINHRVVSHLSRDEGADASRFGKRRTEQEKRMAES